MRSYWKIKLWAKFVNHFDVFNNLWSRKTQCDRSSLHFKLCKNRRQYDVTRSNFPRSPYLFASIMAFKLTSMFCTLTCIYTAEVFTTVLYPLISHKTSSSGLTMMTFETNSSQFSGDDLRNSGPSCQSLLTFNSDAL